MTIIGVVPPLNDQQVDAIIQESLRRGYFETGPEGQLPEGDALKDAASELVRQARLSYAAGNRTEGVMEILFVAECDLNPPTIDDQGGQVAAVEDLSKQSSEFLQKLEQTLQNYDPSPEVDENLKMIREELSRRGGNGSSPAEQPVAEANGQVEATPAQTPESSSSRKELEDRLTFPIMRHHGVDPSQITSLSDDELRWIVEHPPGSDDAAPAQQAAPPAPSPDVVETTRMVVEQPEQTPAAATPPAESSTVAETPTGISSERLTLEEQVTGPMLKVYGRGRADVPSIGDNELRFMVENSDGRVTKEALLAARALDEGQISVEEATERQVDAATEGQPPTIAEQSRYEKQDAASGFAPGGTDGEPDTKPDSSGAENVQTPVPSGDSVPPAADTGRVTRKAALMRDLPENPAQEIIDRERFPVPPEISEDPPRLPFDMSKSSDDELRSLHARLHACHSRANYVVGLWDGELRDVVKLRKGREVNVANEVPAKDGRSRVTDAQREAIVAADPEVVSLREQEHNIERVLRQLTTLRDGYGRDVSTCSRQWALRKEESSGAGGLK